MRDFARERDVEREGSEGKETGRDVLFVIPLTALLALSKSWQDQKHYVRWPTFRLNVLDGAESLCDSSSIRKFSINAIDCYYKSLKIRISYSSDYFFIFAIYIALISSDLIHNYSLFNYREQFFYSNYFC